MSVTRFKTSTVTQGLPKFPSFWDARTGVTSGSYDALATVTVPSGGVSSITFAGIPQTGYSHLQIRISVVTSSTGTSAKTTFNDINPNVHWMTGNGSTTQSAYDANFLYFPLTQGSTTSPVVGIMDILDYTKTDKFKTTRTLEGYDNNGSGNVSLTSGLWRNTSSINKITITTGAGLFNQNSSFALYGVKA